LVRVCDEERGWPQAGAGEADDDGIVRTTRCGREKRCYDKNGGELSDVHRIGRGQGRRESD